MYLLVLIVTRHHNVVLDLLHRKGQYSHSTQPIVAIDRNNKNSRRTTISHKIRFLVDCCLFFVMRLTCKNLVDTARVDCCVNAGTPQLLDRRFCSAFGARIVVVVKLWNLLDQQNLLPGKPQVRHVLWMLAFLKSYLPEEEYRRQYAVTEKTFRKWVWIYMDACSNIRLVSTTSTV
jgi:hypothetical protein